ncbi:hypothetical protein B0T22DRAFT_477384 [Podospora appendiculata]|uniref:Uncharacterized protein n=1 Tax=Podospora appendiculata TaxID=314037 RepID=A0AAE0XJQ8_9PEZI|nr:hypothetical protein B0T22DRAFT_477384 [Podospora appendiculata]
MATHLGQEEYSTLEVVPSHLQQSYGLEVSNRHVYDPNDKQAVPAECDPTAYPFARPSSKDIKADGVKHWKRQPEDLFAPPPTSTIWGIRRRTFWILTGLVVFVVIAAAVGGGVAVVSAFKNSQAVPTSSNSNTNSSSPGTSNTTSPVPSNTTRPMVFQNLSIAALH